jgi:dihydrofolate reductase
MGRKSFEDATIESIEIFKSKKLFVATHRKLNTKSDNVEVINGDIVNIISKLKKEKGKDIWLYGGAILADQFIKKNIIDEYIIAIIPIILGGGIQLFLKNNPKIELHLNECVVQDGMVIVKYKKRK